MPERTTLSEPICIISTVSGRASEDALRDKVENGCLPGMGLFLMLKQVFADPSAGNAAKACLAATRLDPIGPSHSGGHRSTSGVGRIFRWGDEPHAEPGVSHGSAHSRASQRCGDSIKLHRQNEKPAAPLAARMGRDDRHGRCVKPERTERTLSEDGSLHGGGAGYCVDRGRQDVAGRHEPSAGTASVPAAEGDER